jgi:hypothetical protein
VERFVGRTRPSAALIGALAVAVALPLANAQAEREETKITCTNPASGVKWQIAINYDRSTVDSYPARITDASISWHDDKDMGNYTLDRKTGNLRVVIASSTGGYFLNDHCDLPD